MAFLFDSLAGLALFAACVAAWLLSSRARVGVRVNLRFAAMLLASLAVARLLGLALPQFSAVTPAVALIASSLAATALALGLFATLGLPVATVAATLALALGLGAGLGAALAAAPAYAFGCQLLCVALVLAASIGHLPSHGRRAGLSLLAGLCLLCGGLALMDGALDLALVFFAGSLICTCRASQKLVETQGQVQRLAAVGWW